MLFDNLPRPASQITEGVAHLPGWLSRDQQRELVSEAREIARSLVGTPVGMKRPRVGTGQTAAYIMALGWHWTTHPYSYVQEIEGYTVHPLPASHGRLATEALEAAAQVDPVLAPWVEGFAPDVSLVNYYPPGTGMGMHVDANEESNAPVVSLSIGDEALFRIGGLEDRNKPWDDVVLMSGDLIVFGGPKRRAYHGVVDVRAGTLPAECGLDEGRINITIRQHKTSTLKA